jgi:Mrp family chromosome partitioning ATPase
MTILEAIERAKRIRAEAKQREEDGDSSPKAVNTARRRKAELVPTAAAVSLQFPRLSLDTAVCERNRVLISLQPGHPLVRAADSYRILRTRLRNRLSAEASPSVGIVSAGADEGKSLTAINLALAFANERRRNVFLVDLDLRNPSICPCLGVTPLVEIGRCLAHEVKPEEVFFQTDVDNLILAGGFTRYENSSELLGGAALGELFECIRRTDPNALVVVDLPPLLQSADALVVVPHVTALLLVVAEGITRRDNLNRATEVLAGMAVAGVVLNRSREAVEDYYG